MLTPEARESIRQRADRILLTYSAVSFMLPPSKGPDFNRDAAELVKDMLAEIERLDDALHRITGIIEAKCGDAAALASISNLLRALAR